MKGYSRYIKWSIALVLALVPIIGFGQDLGNPLWDMFQKLSFTPPKTDMSVAYLGKMFGYVPGIDQFLGLNPTIIGAVFGIFNAGILALSGVFLSYTITKILTETTMDGAAMGKSTTIWTAVRCSLSTSLLVPQASGYSMINSIIMWVVIQSVGLADLTWNRAMDYLKMGGSVITTPKSGFVDYTLINYNIESDDANVNASKTSTNVGSADVLRSLACSYVVHAALVNRQVANRERLSNLKPLTLGQQAEYNRTSAYIPQRSSLYRQGTAGGEEKGFYLSREFEATCTSNKANKGDPCTAYSGGSVVFPYIANEGKANFDPYEDYGLLQTPNIPKKLTGICGTINYNIDPKASSDSAEIYDERAKRYIGAKQQGLSDMIAQLEPVAKELVNKIKLEKGVRKLDPDTYVLYKRDGVSHGFFKNLSPKGGDSAKYAPTNLLSDEPSTLPNDLVFPLGAKEIMHAAFGYQTALKMAQMVGGKAVSDAMKAKYEEAKSFGWIAAGNYYRLLVSMGDSATTEYTSYRLKGAVSPTKIFEKDEMERDKSQTYYMTLFPGATNLTSSPIKALWNTDNKGESDPQLLDKVLKWITVVYPYAKIEGVVASSPIDTTRAATGTKFEDITKTGFGLSWFGSSTTEFTVWAQVAVGAASLMIAPPVAIPFLMNVPMDFLYVDVRNIFNDWNNIMGTSSTAGVDPIVKLQKVGQSMVKNALAYAQNMKIYFGVITVAVSIGEILMSLIGWTAAPASFYGIALGVTIAAGSTIDLYNSLLSITEAIIFMQLPVAIAVLGPIFASGIMLSIYVPLIPYLLFLFGAISWFISVLVLMAAAPIICFLMLWGNSSQENPLLAREAEQFIMQVIGVFFRPTLMIIGLITGMVLSYIGVDLLNLGFAEAVKVVVTETGDGGIRLIQQVGMVVIYTFTMISVVNMCFSTIHLLYSEAMRVAGIQAPAVGMEEKHMEGVKGAVTHFGEAGGGGLKEGAVTLKGSGLKLKGKDSDEHIGKEAAKDNQKGADNKK